MTFKPTMTGPETWGHEMAKAIRWEIALQKMCQYDWLYQDSDETRRFIVDHVALFRFDSHHYLGWAP